MMATPVPANSFLCGSGGECPPFAWCRWLAYIGFKRSVFTDTSGVTLAEPPNGIGDTKFVTAFRQPTGLNYRGNPQGVGQMSKRYRQTAALHISSLPPETSSAVVSASRRARPTALATGGGKALPTWR